MVRALEMTYALMPDTMFREPATHSRVKICADAAWFRIGKRWLEQAAGWKLDAS